MNRKYDYRYVTSIPFEKSVYDEVKALLPKEISIADELNEFLRQRLADLQKDRNMNQSNKCPIKNFENETYRTSTDVKCKQISNLNFYSSIEQIISHVNGLEDSKTAWSLKRKGKLLVSLADTMAKKLQKENK